MRDAKGKTGPVSECSQHLTVFVRDHCDALRSAYASTSERVIWPTSSENANDLSNQAANVNPTRDCSGGDGSGRHRRGGGGSDLIDRPGRRFRGGGSGRNYHGGSGHSRGGDGNGRRMGSVYRGKGGEGHSRYSGWKSSRQNAGWGAGSYISILRLFAEEESWVTSP